MNRVLGVILLVILLTGCVEVVNNDKAQNADSAEKPAPTEIQEKTQASAPKKAEQQTTSEEELPPPLPED